MVKLKALHDKVFDRNISTNYLKWLYINPYGCIPLGQFEGSKLIGFYCGEIRDFYSVKHAICTLAMTDPDYRHQGLFREIALKLYATLRAKGCVFLTLFANKAIVNIYEKYLDFKPIELNKKWIPINHKHFHPQNFMEIFESENTFKKYRFNHHPIKKYEIFMDMNDLNSVILNQYEDQMQIIYASHLTNRIIDYAIMRAHEKNCKYVTLLKDNEGKPIDTWFCYKQLYVEAPSYKEEYFNKLYLGMSDVY